MGIFVYGLESMIQIQIHIVLVKVHLVLPKRARKSMFAGVMAGFQYCPWKDNVMELLLDLRPLQLI